jgi:hypothetical protein
VGNVKGEQHVVTVALAEMDSELEIGDMLAEHGPVLRAGARLVRGVRPGDRQG